MHLRGDTVALDELSELPDDVCPALRRERWNIMLCRAVRLTPPPQRAVADNAVYDISSGVVVLTGKAMKITTPARSGK